MADAEVAQPFRLLVPQRFDMGYARKRRAFMAHPDGAFDRAAIAFKYRFHPTIREVSHPPGQPEAGGNVLREITVGNALYPAVNEETDTNSHGSRSGMVSGFISLFQHPYPP